MQPGLVPQCNSDLADRLLFEPFPGYCSSIKPRQKIIGFSTRAGSGGNCSSMGLSCAGGSSGSGAAVGYLAVCTSSTDIFCRALI